MPTKFGPLRATALNIFTCLGSLLPEGLIRPAVSRITRPPAGRSLVIEEDDSSDDARPALCSRNTACCLRASALQWRLPRRRYRPFPLLRFHVGKEASGRRCLSIRTVRVRVAQTAVFLVTRELFEAEFEDASFAYRQGRSVRTAIHRVNSLREQGFRYLVDADIDAFFDSIPHPKLLDRLSSLSLDPYILELFERWELELHLNREKTRITSFDQGFEFLGAVFIKDSIYLPFDRHRPEPVEPVLPSPLDLWTYLELRADGCE